MHCLVDWKELGRWGGRVGMGARLFVKQTEATDRHRWLFVVPILGLVWTTAKKCIGQEV